MGSPALTTFTDTTAASIAAVEANDNAIVAEIEGNLEIAQIAKPRVRWVLPLRWNRTYSCDFLAGWILDKLSFGLTEIEEVRVQVIGADPATTPGTDEYTVNLYADQESSADMNVAWLSPFASYTVDATTLEAGGTPNLTMSSGNWRFRVEVVLGGVMPILATGWLAVTVTFSSEHLEAY